MIDKVIWFLKTNLLLRFRIKTIGLLTYIGSPTHLYGGNRIFIGNKVRIFPGSRMEVHNNGSIVMENDIAVGQNLHLISSNEQLKICCGTTISGNVLITNIDHDYTEIDVHILKQKFLVKTTHIGENCFIGYGAVLQAGTILGKQCIVGANSVVRGVFPDYCVIAGAPAKIVKRYNMQTKNWEKTDSNEDFIK
jgi:acetyltransferase-like isoleucine patch superfamily enzyme